MDTGSAEIDFRHVTFPIPFKEKVKSVIMQRHTDVSPSHNTSWYYNPIRYGSVSLTGFDFGFNFGTTPNAFHWVAIGK